MAKAPKKITIDLKDEGDIAAVRAASMNRGQARQQLELAQQEAQKLTAPAYKFSKETDALWRQVVLSTAKRLGSPIPDDADDYGYDPDKGALWWQPKARAEPVVAAPVAEPTPS